MKGIPLPALKPNEEGGYTFCPKCAIAWVCLLGVIFGAFLAWKKGLLKV